MQFERVMSGRARMPIFSFEDFDTPSRRTISSNRSRGTSARDVLNSVVLDYYNNLWCSEHNLLIYLTCVALFYKYYTVHNMLHNIVLKAMHAPPIFHYRSC